VALRSLHGGSSVCEGREGGSMSHDGAGTPRRGVIITMADLKARCISDPATHCWVWQGGMSDGSPRIWTIDYSRPEKRSMSGALAAWHIGHGEPPREGWLVFRACHNSRCVNPAHMRLARDKAEVNRHAKACGAWVGTAVESRRANAVLARAASKWPTLSPEKVAAVRQALAAGERKVLIAQRLGLSKSAVHHIASGRRHAVAQQGVVV
jgi:hypothetical protein